MNNGLSTVTEVKKRASIVEICKSIIRADTYICILMGGSQLNINGEVYNQLNYVENNN